jgi:hypothetical protein
MMVQSGPLCFNPFFARERLDRCRALGFRHSNTTQFFIPSAVEESIQTAPCGLLVLKSGFVKPLSSKHKGEKQQQGGDNGACESDFRPFQVPCVSRVLLLEFIIIVIYAAVVPGAQTKLNEDIPRDGYHKQRARYDVEHNVHNVFAGMIAGIMPDGKSKIGHL